MVTAADIRAASERIRPIARRTPVIHFAAVRRGSSNARAFQVRDVPARGRLQDPRSDELPEADPGGRPAARRGRLLFGQSRAGGGDRGGRTRDEGDAGDAERRTGGQTGGHPGLRRRSHPVRPAARGPGGDRARASREGDRGDAGAAVRPRVDDRRARDRRRSSFSRSCRTSTRSWCRSGAAG